MNDEALIERMLESDEPNAGHFLLAGQKLGVFNERFAQLVEIGAFLEAAALMIPADYGDVLLQWGGSHAGAAATVAESDGYDVVASYWRGKSSQSEEITHPAIALAVACIRAHAHMKKQRSEGLAV